MIDSPCGKGSAAVIPAKPLTRPASRNQTIRAASQARTAGLLNGKKATVTTVARSR